MYALTIHTARHDGGTKFYRTVVASGPDSSVAIYQWGAIKGGIPIDTSGGQHSSQFFRNRSAAWSDSSKKRSEKGRRGYKFKEEANLSHASLSAMMQSELFRQSLSDADKARILTSLFDPKKAEMEGMESHTLAEITARVAAGAPATSSNPWGSTPAPAAPAAPVTPTVAPATAVNPAEHYGEQWGSW